MVLVQHDEREVLQQLQAGVAQVPGVPQQPPQREVMVGECERRRGPTAVGEKDERRVRLVLLLGFPYPDGIVPMLHRLGAQVLGVRQRRPVHVRVHEWP